jgi:UDP-N-acetylmuramate dehydrogenase
MNKIPVELQKIKLDEEFAKFSHIKIGPALPYLFAPQSYEQLQKILLWATQNKLRIFPVGGASNILMGKTENTVVILDRFLPTQLELRNRKVICSANLNINYILMQAALQKMGGLEFLAGIPANLGGIIKMNAGAYQQSISEFIQNITVMEFDGKINKYDISQLKFGYRSSSISGFILAAELKLLADTTSYDKIRLFLQNRQSSQPLKSANLGCFFKNPNGNSAGKLIDKAGLKGYSHKNMQVSNKHANFLINTAQADLTEAKELIEIVRKRVAKKFSIELELEVKVVQ